MNTIIIINKCENGEGCRMFEHIESKAGRGLDRESASVSPADLIKVLQMSRNRKIKWVMQLIHALRDQITHNHITSRAARAALIRLLQIIVMMGLELTPEVIDGLDELKQRYNMKFVNKIDDLAELLAKLTRLCAGSELTVEKLMALLTIIQDTVGNIDLDETLSEAKLLQLESVARKSQKQFDSDRKLAQWGFRPPIRQITAQELNARIFAEDYLKRMVNESNLFVLEFSAACHAIQDMPNCKNRMDKESVSVSDSLKNKVDVMVI